MREEAIRYWARFFGLPPTALEADGVHVVPHVGLADYHGAWLFWLGGTVVVSVPPERVAAIQDAAETLVGSFPKAEHAQRLFGAEVEQCIGPAYQGYLERAAFRPRPHPGVRLLSEGDATALDRLRDACGEIAWDHASIAPENGASVWGLLQNDELLAAAQCEPWVPGVASPGVVAHPSHRGRGYGRAVVSAAVAEALGDGDLVLYQTLLSNAPAVTVARSLGFQHLATHVAVRFRR